MERTNGIQNAVKKAAAVLFLTAAMASTGCGQNALMNPTAAQVSAGSSSYTQAGSNLNPAGSNLNPSGSLVKTSAGSNLNP